MGFRPNINTWRTGAEGVVAKAQERGMNFSDLIDKSRTQAKMFVENNAPKAQVFISAGLRDNILNAKDRIARAKTVARDEPHYVLDTLDDMDHQAAFLVALAEELSDAKYNQ